MGISLTRQKKTRLATAPGRSVTSYFLPDFNPSESRSSPDSVTSRSNILVLASTCEMSAIPAPALPPSLDPQAIDNAVNSSAVEARVLNMPINLLSVCFRPSAIIKRLDQRRTSIPSFDIVFTLAQNDHVAVDSERAILRFQH